MTSAKSVELKFESRSGSTLDGPVRGGKIKMSNLYWVCLLMHELVIAY